jgi:cytochrome c oxidase subunit 2
MSTMSEFDDQADGAAIGIGLVIMLFTTLAVIAIYATAVGTSSEWTSLDVLGNTWGGLPDDAAIAGYDVVDADAGKYRIPVRVAMAAAARNPSLLGPASSASAVAVADMTPEQKGAEIFEAKACTVCHSVDGSEGGGKLGPSLLGKWGTQEKLADGSSVLVDAAYIAESIRDPEAKVVANYPPVMTVDQKTISDEDIELLTVYIQSLAN